jgi:hypothetical protein
MAKNSYRFCLQKLNSFLNKQEPRKNLRGSIIFNEMIRVKSYSPTTSNSRSRTFSLPKSI